MQQTENAVRFDGDHYADRGPVFQVIVTNISWGPNSIKNFHTRHDDNREPPVQTSFDFTGARYDKLMKLDGKAFNDEVEKTIYEVLTFKYGREVWGASIWLPFED